MEMLDTDDPALWYALNRLIINYWAGVDDNGGSRAHEFYLANALYAVGGNRFEGGEKIRAFYDRRRAGGNGSTRHLIPIRRLCGDEPRSARMMGVRPPHRADGRPPILQAKPAALIA